MPTIKLENPVGIIPKTAPRSLPNNAGQTANNLKLTSGEMTPYNGVWPIAQQPVRPGPFLSIYNAVDVASDGSVVDEWLAWDADTDCVRMPFDVENDARFAWTGDVCPRYGTYANITNGGLFDYPKVSYALGIPRPAAAPSVSHSGGTGAAVSRFYCYTYYNPATGEESGPSAISTIYTGKVDGTWAITAMSPLPLNTGTITGATFSAGVVTVTCSAAHNLRKNDQVTIASVVGMVELNTTHTIYAVPSATTFKVKLASATAYISGGTWTRTVAWNISGMVRRLYRTSGTTGAFQLVADNIAGTTYDDTILDAAIPGDDLLTDGWEPPLADLTCLRVTPSGSLVGISGTLICLSEPFQPHAWPAAYQFGCDFPLVGVGLAGTDVIGVTTANPYLLTGTDPASMYNQKITGIYPGLSKRSIVSDGNACYFATKSGMAAVAGGQVQIVTSLWFTQDEWQTYNPATMFSAHMQDRIFVGYVDADANKRMLCFNFPYQQLTTLDVSANALYVDETSGDMWVTTTSGICAFDSDEATPLTMEWRSKEFVLAEPCNFGAAKVVFDTGLTPQAADAIAAARVAATAENVALLAADDMHGGFNFLAFNTQPFNASNAAVLPEFPDGSSITFTLYDGTELIWSGVIESIGAFRLPAGLKMDRPNVKINAQGRVGYVLMAETMSALRAA